MSYNVRNALLDNEAHKSWSNMRRYLSKNMLLNLFLFINIE